MTFWGTTTGVGANFLTHQDTNRNGHKDGQKKFEVEIAIYIYNKNGLYQAFLNCVNT